MLRPLKCAVLGDYSLNARLLLSLNINIIFITILSILFELFTLENVFHYLYNLYIL